MRALHNFAVLLKAAGNYTLQQSTKLNYDKLKHEMRIRCVSFTSHSMKHPFYNAYLDGACEIKWSAIYRNCLNASNEVISKDLARSLLQGIHCHHATQVHGLIVEVECPVKHMAYRMKSIKPYKREKHD